MDTTILALADGEAICTISLGISWLRAPKTWGVGDTLRAFVDFVTAQDEVVFS